jgi:hypothetical protein
MDGHRGGACLPSGSILTAGQFHHQSKSLLQPSESLLGLGKCYAGDEDQACDLFQRMEEDEGGPLPAGTIVGMQVLVAEAVDRLANPAEILV